MSEVEIKAGVRIAEYPGAGKCYGGGLDILKKNFLELLLVTVVVSAFWMVYGIAQAASEKHFFMSPIYGMFCLGYAILIMNPINYGKNYVYLKGAREEKPNIKDLFAFQKKYFDVVLAALLTGAIIMFGLVFLIVPGIIFACKLAFVPYIVLDKELDAIEAVKQSWKMSRGYAGTVFLIGLISLPVFILGLICLGVGVIVSSMWVTSAMAYLYNRVSMVEGEEVISA